MSDPMIEKLLYQIEAVLAGEATVLEVAQKYNIDIERIDAEIRTLLQDKKVFTGSMFQDLVMAGYVIGRRDQFFASMSNLFGQEEMKSYYAQVCLKLGIQPKQIKQVH